MAVLGGGGHFLMSEVPRYVTSFHASAKERDFVVVTVSPHAALRLICASAFIALLAGQGLL